MRSFGPADARCVFSFLVLTVLAGVLAWPAPLRARNVMFPHIAPPAVDMAGVGFGFYPQYMGADEYYFGAAPLARVHFDGERYFELLINELMVNVIDDPNWSLGPLALMRFGRYDVDDDVVNRMQDIYGTVELGGFVGYTFNYGESPLQLLNGTLSAQADVGGVHNGWLMNASVNGLVPIVEFLTFTGGMAGTWASEDYNDTYFGVSGGDALRTGLEVYNPGAGMHDLRFYGGLLFHLSLNWHIGAGAMYSNLLGPGGDSPIVTERGTPSQWAFGSGVIYSW